MPGRLSIVALAQRLSQVRGWRRRGIAFGAGAASVLALAPFFLWPVLWLTLPILVWLLDGAAAEPEDGGRRLRRSLMAAAGTGWWFGFGYFLAGLFWIGEAFLVEADKFAVFMPLAVLVMPAGLAFFYAAATAGASLAWRSGIWRVLALALALSAAEWLRGHILTGFPWNVLGYALTYPVSLMQSAAVFGIYALTLFTVLVFAFPAVIWTEAQGKWHKSAAVAAAVLPILAGIVAGHIRLARAENATIPGVKLRIVQPSVLQRDKWRPEHQLRIFNEHLDLSRRNASGEIDNLAGITHVIWPEAAMPFLPLDTPEALKAIGDLLPANTVLITGALRAERAPPDAPRPRMFFNSLLVLGAGGRLITLYDKIQLVPFGEFLPLRPLLESIGLRQLTHLIGGFHAGATPRPLLSVEGLPPVLPLICYEGIFPATLLPLSERPGIIVNITNDGWFGNTTGPRQHFHQSRVRAVEQGVPLVRAANNGVSAVFDPYGRSVGRMDLNVRGVLDVGLPAALQPPLYGRIGDLAFFTIWLLGAGILGWVVRR